MQTLQRTEKQSPNILHGSGDNESNRQYLGTMRRALPPHEYGAAVQSISCLFGYQQNWVLDSSRFAALVKCRQIGGSHSYGLAAALWGQLGEHTSIVSKGEREGKDVLKFTLKHAQALAKLGSKWAVPVSVSSERIELASGATITALPSTSGGRGKSGNMILDEAAYLQHPEEVWDGAAATVMHGYRMRVLSTPNGTDNLFYKICADTAGSGFTKHQTTLHEAMEQGLAANVPECWKMALNDPRLFAQLFECSFLDGDQQYIATEMVQSAVDDTEDAWAEGVAYAGLDVGITHDASSLVILTQDRNAHVKVRAIWVGKRTDWLEQQRVIGEAITRWGIRRLCVDSTGIGHGMAEALKEKFGRTRIEPIAFTLQSKEKLATDLYQAFADSMITIPRDEALLKDICAIRRIVTASGNIRYDAARTSEGHADRAWALALAISACSTIPSRVTQLTGGDFQDA
jgi:phage FluMu gp28-like protein